MALHRGSSPNESTTGSSNALLTEANPALGQRLTSPKSRLAQDPVPADVAYQLIHDELLLDGSARLNLATFVTTWMEPQARQLMADCVDKNMIDKDEYPQTAELERRCVAMLADLPQHLHFTPTSSSWVNLIERWFKELTDKRLRRGVFTNVPELVEAITTWGDHWNDDPSPFI